METILAIFQATSAYHIGWNGIRKYCDVTVASMNLSRINLSIRGLIRGLQINLSLDSTDGFTYSGRSDYSGRHVILTLQYFTHDTDVILTGTCTQQGQDGEFFIRGTLREVRFDSRQSVNLRILEPAN